MKQGVTLVCILMSLAVLLLLTHSSPATSCAQQEPAQAGSPPPVGGAPAEPDESTGDAILTTLLGANAAGGTVDESIEDQLTPLFLQLTPDVVFVGPGGAGVGGVTELPNLEQPAFLAAPC
jgi:hypothetical protein